MEENSLDQWFVREILPLEPMLTRFLRRRWSDEAEVADLRQEAYVRIYESAGRGRPHSPKQFLFQVVRNLIIDRLRQKSVVPIETITDFEWSIVSSNEPLPERQVAARQQIRMLQDAMDALPPRCREVVILRKVEGLSQREVAKKMGITEDTVERQVAKAMRILAQSMLATRMTAVSEAKLYVARSRSTVK